MKVGKVLADSIHNKMDEATEIDKHFLSRNILQALPFTQKLSI